MFDDTANDVGSLVSWSLAIKGASEPAVLTSAAGEYAFAALQPGTYQVREIVPAAEVQTLPAENGGYTVAIVAGQVAAGNDFGSRLLPTSGEIRGTVWNDENGDGLRDSGEPGLGNWPVFLDTNGNGSRDVDTLSIAATNVPRPIADLATATSSLVVSGFAGPISDVNVTLNIQHTFVNDLQGFLISPSGTRVKLFSRVGDSGDNFENTTFDDESLPAIATGTAPFRFSFRPELPLSALDGETANGTWTLEISDMVANDAGSLTGWSLQLSGGGEPLATTAATGAYAFTNLPPGSYTPRQILPAAWVQTFPAASEPLQVNVGDVLANIDFGSQNTQPNQPLLPDIFVWASQPRGYMYGYTIDSSSQPGRRLLRFDTAIANLGAGPLDIRGSTTHPDGTQDVLQRIYDTSGGFTDRLAGTFIFHPEHGHIHFHGYAQYNLRSMTPGGGVGSVVAAAEKTSFCLLDVAKFDQPIPGAPASPHYISCTEFQGISVGWADVYGKSLPDQWVDITGLPAGTYWLEIVADPDNQLVELDETNNVMRIEVQVTGSGSPLLLEAPATEVKPLSPLPSRPVPILRQPQLASIIAAATARLVASLGVASTAALAGVTVEIADLPENQLAYSFGRTILIDANATGRGWFVDQSPLDDREFSSRSANRLLARQNTAAVNRADLLTAVMHEMGHLLGNGHSKDGGLMDATLPLGTRRLFASATEAIFSAVGQKCGCGGAKSNG